MDLVGDEYLDLNCSICTIGGRVLNKVIVYNVCTNQGVKRS